MASNVVVKDIMQKDVKVVNNNTVMQEVVAIMNKFDKDAILSCSKRETNRHHHRQRRSDQSR